MNNPYKITNQLDLARLLTDKFANIAEKREAAIDTTAGKDGLNANSRFAFNLLSLRDIVWPKDKDNKPAGKERLEQFRKAVDIFRIRKGDDSETVVAIKHKKKEHFLEAYAKMGHLYEIAGLAARHNYFMELRSAGKPLPGGATEFLTSDVNANLSQEELLAKLAKPVFEVVMTMHPTNTNSLEMMKAQRRLAKALESDNSESVNKALQEFADVNLLHQKDGKDANFTVRDEINVILHHLGNFYEDLPEIYRQYDRPLKEKKFGDDYNKLALHLNVRPSSWGSSGDNDGNRNVNAETTLLAIALHTDAILERYCHDLENVNTHSQQVNAWQIMLSEKHKYLQDVLLPKITGLYEKTTNIRANKLEFSPQELSDSFDELSKELANVRKDLDAKKFASDLEVVYRASSPEDLNALNLIRRVRTFGFNFAKIEYRQTAEEYARVVEAVVGGYDKLTPEQREERLTEILGKPGNAAKELLDKVKDEIIKHGAGMPYKFGKTPEDRFPVAYNTLKRMELARDFPDMITDNVLAECGKLDKEGASEKEVVAKGVSNILEAKFIQRMAEKDGKSPLLGIIPLFEEPSTMKYIDAIMGGAYQNEVYKAHLAALEPRNDGKRTQQVQIAHSDNARRSGMAGARGYIHRAHKALKAVNENFGITTQIFQGGSISDSYRNGVRAISATVDDFGLHEFAKFTFQGGDLINYFNAPSSSSRLLSRNIVHAAERKKRKVNDVVDSIAIESLIATQPQYEKEDFQNSKLGVVLSALEGRAEVAATNRGSRAGNRSASNADDTKEFKPIDVNDGVRTIGFSTIMQNNGIVPSWIGSQHLEENLLAETKKKLKSIGKINAEDRSDAENKFLELLDRHGFTEKSTEMPAALIHDYYVLSPSFRDAEDRIAYALAMTDPESLKWLRNRMKQLAEEFPGQKDLIESGKHYMNSLVGDISLSGFISQDSSKEKSTYEKAARLAYAAQKGEPLKTITNITQIREEIAASLKKITEDIVRKSDYRDPLFYLKTKHIPTASDYTDNNLTAAELARMGNALCTSSHGRMLLADDSALGDHMKGQIKEQAAKKAASRG